MTWTRQHHRRAVAGAGLTLAVVAALLLAGCTPSGETSETDTAPASSTYDGEALRQSWLADIAQQRNLTDQPDVDLVRYVAIDDWDQAMVDCLHEAGWTSAAVDEAGGVLSGDVPTAQVGAMNLAFYTCAAEYSIEPKYLAPLSDAQLEVMYTYFVDTLVPCLEEHGHSIDEIPSHDTWLATAELAQQSPDGGYYWTPYEDVPASGGDSWRTLNEACPQNPPTENLYQ